MTWEVGLSTGIAYRRPIGEVLEAIGRSEFRTIEVCTAPEHLDLRRLERLEPLRQHLAGLKIRVHSLHAPFGHNIDLTSPDPGCQRRSLDQLTRAADALQILGGGLYVIHPGGEDHDWAWDREGRLRRSVAGLTHIWELCRQRGLKLVVETPLPHLLGGQPRDLDWLLEQIPSEDMGVCIDTSHCSLGGFLLDSIERLGPRLAHIQVSDNGGAYDDHWPPGEGVIDWPRVISALERAKYAGVFMLEVTGSRVPLEDVERAAAGVRRTLPEALKTV